MFLLASCERDHVIPDVDVGYDYYPDNIGKYVIYEVDSVSWDGFYSPPLKDSVHYQVKELFQSDYVDNEGRTVVRIEQYCRKTDTSEWQIKKIVSSVKTSQRVEQMEDNTRYIKLAFPVISANQWNGNAFNTKQSETYSYQKINEPFFVNGVEYTQSLLVQHYNLSTVISEDSALEVYSKGIGLIYKRTIHLEKNTNGNLKSGYKYSYSIKSYNN